MSTSSQLCTMPAEAQQDIKAFARKCSRAKEPLAIICECAKLYCSF